MSSAKIRELMLQFYDDGIAQGLNHLDASTYAEEKFSELYKQ